MTTKKEKKKWTKADKIVRHLQVMGNQMDTDRTVAMKLGVAYSYVTKVRKERWKEIDHCDPELGKPVTEKGFYVYHGIKERRENTNKELLVPPQKIPVHITDKIDPPKIGDFAYNLTKGGKPPEEGTYTRSSVLDTAKQYVTKDRDATHGNMEDNFREIAELWNQYFNCERSFSPIDVAVMMALLKIARLKSNKDNPDNYIDACGYMACAGELALKKVTKK